MWFQKHWAAVAGLLFTALYVYLQLLQWRAHGDDLMLTAANILVTCALWIMLMIAIGRYWKDGRRAKRLDAELVSIKDQHKNKVSAMEQQHRQELENRRLSLFEEAQAKYRPPESGLKEQSEENFRLYLEQVEETKKLRIQLRDLTGQRDHANAQIAEINAAAKIPQLLMQYVERDRQEVFIFINEGPASVQHIAVGELEMDKRSLHPPGVSQTFHVNLTLFNALGFIVPQDRAESKFGASTNKTGQPLRAYMRDFLQVDWDCNYSIMVTYDDLDGHRFSRKFSLYIDPYDQVAIEAGPVLRVSSEAL